MELNFQTERKMMRKGFTLIELLVVVLIMGILASVALPQYYKSVEKSRAQEAINVLKSLASSYERACMKDGNVARLDDDIQSYLDMSVPRMNYFNNEISVLGAGGIVMFVATRNTSAGGGLGSYVITLSIPRDSENQNGRFTWNCEPKSAGCRNLFFAKWRHDRD